MKKNWIIILVVIIMTSCRVDEYPDAIIGAWKVSKIDGSTNIGCQNQSTLMFTNTEIESIDYEGTPGSCTIRAQFTETYSLNDSLIILNSTPPETVEILYMDHETLELQKPEGTGFTTLTLLRQ